MKNLTKFIKGTSVLASLPTLLYIGVAQRRNRLELLDEMAGQMSEKMENFLTLSYEFLPLYVSLVYVNC